MYENHPEVKNMTPEEYIKAREEILSQKAAGPKEGDTKVETNNGNSVSYTFYQGNWVEDSDLPEDHPNSIPF